MDNLGNENPIDVDLVRYLDFNKKKVFYSQFHS